MRKKEVNGFPYSLPRIWPGADPSVQAVSPQASLGSRKSAPKRHLDQFSSFCIHHSKVSQCFSMGRTTPKWPFPPERSGPHLRLMSHLQFYRVILLCNFIAQQNRKCDMQCCTMQLCRINKNWPISGHRIFTTKLHRIERCSNRQRSVVTTTELSPPSRCFTVFLAVFLGTVSWKLPHTIPQSSDNHLNAASFDPAWMLSRRHRPPSPTCPLPH